MVNVESEPSSQPESKPTVKLETEKPTVKLEGERKSEPRTKTEPGPSVKPESEPSVKNETKPTVKHEAEKPQERADTEVSEDEEEGGCDCYKCEAEKKERDCNPYVGHLVINMGVEKMSFEKDEWGIYRCPEPCCYYSHRDSNKLRRHYKIHSGERQYKCGLCDKSFNQRGTCMNHIRTHDDKYKFKCPEYDCDKKFANNQYLKRHAMKEHGLNLSRGRRFGLFGGWFDDEENSDDEENPFAFW